MSSIASESARKTGLRKAPTGIEGLDEITDGGLPGGRPTLVSGSAGCGKTLLAMEFLIRGATQFGEPGVFIAFEETTAELVENVRSLGFDVEDLVKQGKLSIQYVRVERTEIQETGEYDLEGLFVRIGHAVDRIGAKRVVLDTIESLFSGFSNAAVLRAELRRLFRWLKDKGVTAVITAERGQDTLTRQGLEEYVSDCVILLDHRVVEQVSTRRLRIVKYRGSTHGTNEYPFLIDGDGISVLPITSAGLRHRAREERVSTGVERLDAMLDGKGFYRGSSVLVTGTAGTGKTSLASQFALAACQRGEKCLFFAFEEAPDQINRNMRSIGIDLAPWVENGQLLFHAVRATMHGFEMHLASMHKIVRSFEPDIVIVDPVGSLMQAGTASQTSAMLMRLLDFLKMQGITAFMTNLTPGEFGIEQTAAGISSLVDTWILVRDVELAGERNRAIYILKSRGMAHSNQLREFHITDHGIELTDVYLGPEGVLTGSMRLAQKAREAAAEQERQDEADARRRERTRKREALEARIIAMRKEFEAEEKEADIVAEQEQAKVLALERDRADMAESRQADAHAAGARQGTLKGNEHDTRP